MIKSPLFPSWTHLTPLKSILNENKPLRYQCIQQYSFSWLPGGLMVKWFVSVSASIAERMSGISSNPADDLALAKIEKKEMILLTEKIRLF